jgi:uncharacterized protein (TIGR02453 family)
MAQPSYFGPGLFQFLSELKANNDRQWFAENRSRYERQVKEPLLQFIADFAPRLQAISPCFEADSRPVGGSMFRLHRDTRFSKDKSPYKTHAAAHFRHEAGKDAHATGFYLHLEPGGCMAGGGIWHPDSPALDKIRSAIVEHPDRWQAVLDQVPPLSGDSLQRPPRGYDPNHPFVADLKRKDFVLMLPLQESQVCSPTFLDTYAETCRSMTPLVHFLTTSLGLPY